MRLFEKLKTNKILLPALLALLFLVSAIASPLILKNRKDNWDKVLEEKIRSSENIIRNIFDDKILAQVEFNSSIKKSIKKNYSSSNLNSIYKKLVLSWDDNYSIQIFDNNGKLIFWKGNEILSEDNLPAVEKFYGQVVFRNNKLITFLSLLDSCKIGDQNCVIVTGLPIENESQNLENEKENLSESVSKRLSTSVKIYYDPKTQLKRDGRLHSFTLMNNFKNKIAVVDFEKPALDNELNELSNKLNLAQSIIFILLLLTISIPAYKNLKKKKRIVRFIFVAFSAAILRFVLFFTGIPSQFVQNELTNASNFSSTFAFGMVRSPLEFTITAVLGLLVIVLGFKYFLEFHDDQKKINQNWKTFAISLLPVFILILLTLRGLGASLRSVVFDSSIRYFKEFNLIPDAATFLMDFNILVVGFGVFLFCLILLIALNLFVPEISKRQKKYLFAAMFLLIQISGVIFDVVQKQPQGTPLIRVLFITVLFTLGYLLIFNNYRSVIKYLYIAFGASIAAVSLLTYYNSEIERESLKTTAQDLTRSNEGIYRFMVFQLLSSIQNDTQISNVISQNKNLSSLAFIEWKKSLLYHESLPVEISFYDSSLKKIGSFSNAKFEKYDSILPDLKRNLQSPDVELIPSVFGDKIFIHGSTEIKNNETVAGYASVILMYDESFFNFVNLPDFLLPEKSGISSALNIERLKIFYFHNGSLERSFGSVQLSDDNIKKITGHKFSKYNEAWMSFKIAGENYLFYILNVEGNEQRILAVAKEEKNFTWNLSDFFKVFFIHTVIILTVFLFIAIWNYKKLKTILSGYKMKLASAFVVVSVIPMIVIAVYFKNITESKNSELIFNRLDESAGQIENYFKNYLSSSSVQPEIIFQKTSADLGVNFNVYSNKKIIYSSNIDYYKAGLLPEIIPMNVWFDISDYGLEKSFYKSVQSGKKNYSVFLKSNVADGNIVIEVNSELNSASLPLSDIEVDVFLFGVFSLAIIMLIIFSTILAEQISAPVRKLTNATRSLGSGDLSVEVTGKYSGEIAELTNGFNMMVKRLRKSQIEMAQLERENAWKEMAKQVAHEIKNPLTPMKLSVQQLIAAYKDKSPKFDSIFEKVTSTVIAQIETLKNIASEFSNFARMPKLNIEKINLVDSVNETVNLFQNENLQIKYSCVENEIYIYADHDQLNRTLINLVRNSMQASSKNIFINVSVENDLCMLRVIDDGRGIEKENVEKVFEDNFTTKSGGMGLGLSMAKKFLENINGNIVIEKTSEDGTVFLITIPIAE